MRCRDLLLLLALPACGSAAAIDAGPADAGPPDTSPLDAAVLDLGTDAGVLDLGGDAATRDAGPPPCALTPSGPVVVTTPGAIVEHLDITTDGAPGIEIRDAPGVVIRDLRIRYRGAPGIAVRSSADVQILRVDVDHVGAPAAGAADSDDRNDIDVYDSPRLVVTHVRVSRGSSGLYLLQAADSLLTEIEGHDFRGPFPRGQLAQFDDSSGSTLDGFSSVCPAATSWTEDNVNVYHSTGVTVRHGLVDGNNSPSGVGVIFDDMASGTVEDVDAIHQGNGCFSAYAGLDGSVFRRTRCRDNVCTDQGRGAPSSGGLMWAGNPAASVTHLRIESSTWFAACAPGNIVWPDTAFEVSDVTELDFTPRAALDLDFCFDGT